MKKILVFLLLITGLVKAQVVVPKSTTSFSNVLATGNLTVNGTSLLKGTVTASGNINVGGSGTFTGSITTPTLYGSSSASGGLYLFSNPTATPGIINIPTYTNVTSLQFGSISSNNAATIINAGAFGDEIQLNSIGASSVSCGERLFFKTTNGDNQQYCIGNETRIANRKTSGTLVELNGLSGIVEFKTNHGGSGQNAGVLGVSLMTHSATMSTNTLVIGVRGRNEYSGTGTTGGTSAGGWFERALFSNGAVSTSLDYALISNGYVGILGDGTSVLNTAGIAWRHDAANSDAKTMYQFRNSVGTMFFNDNSNSTLFAIGQDHYHSMNMSPSANTELAIQQYSVNNNDIIVFYNVAGIRTVDFYTDASGHGAFSVRTSAGTTTINLDGSNGTITSKHLKGNGTTPTATLSTGAGTGATYTLTNNTTDLSGTINITAAGTPAANATIITLTFNTAYGTAPKVILTPANSNAALLTGSTQVYVNTTTTTLIIKSGTTGISTGDYIWNYACFE